MSDEQSRALASQPSSEIQQGVDSFTAGLTRYLESLNLAICRDLRGRTANQRTAAGSVYIPNIVRRTEVAKSGGRRSMFVEIGAISLGVNVAVLILFSSLRISISSFGLREAAWVNY